MTTLATLLRPGSQINQIAAGALPSGSVIITPECNLAVMQGLKAAVANDPVRFDLDQVYNFTNNNISWNAGDSVYFDGTSIQNTGFIRIGRVVQATANTVALVPVRLYKDAQLAKYAQAAASSVLTNSTVATILSSIPAIPANTLRAGDTIKLKAQGICPSTNSTDTLQPTLLLTPGTSGSPATLIQGTAVDVANNDLCIVEFTLQIRTIGVSGTMVGNGSTFTGTPGTASSKPAAMASATIDTTQAQTLGLQYAWSVANAGDQFRLDMCDVEIFRS